MFYKLHFLVKMSFSILTIAHVAFKLTLYWTVDKDFVAVENDLINMFSAMDVSFIGMLLTLFPATEVATRGFIIKISCLKTIGYRFGIHHACIRL
jgi:hypothetical protein